MCYLDVGCEHLLAADDGAAGSGRVAAVRLRSPIIPPAYGDLLTFVGVVFAALTRGVDLHRGLREQEREAGRFADGARQVRAWRLMDVWRGVQARMNCVFGDMCMWVLS